MKFETENEISIGKDASANLENENGFPIKLRPKILV